ncbi:ADP-ribosyl cyclase/cyclic ADP-ribose hydrolase-like [Oscarella lobularis]|uniref:ADP-ribosyl cyclase/cyclic ADP-ribose hydrolase-like n=1 Tax=Oscarella lobularis TaxID=121494 RepID=UPI00331313B8
MPSSIAFSLIFSLALALLVHDGVNCQTTPAIERIFLGRCAYFTQFGYMKPNVNCVQAWQEFRGAFASKDPCKVPKAAYAKYFSITGQVPPKDKTLLWSGTQQLKSIYCANGINCYANDQFLPSYIVGQMNWCGSTSDPSGMNFTGCESYDPKNCPDHVTYSFWAAASEQLALASTGRVQLLLNGTRVRDDAYGKTSFFALYELPNLSPNRVSPLWTIVALTPGQGVKENCNNGSLIQLKSDVLAQGLNYACTTAPPRVRHLSCAFFVPPGKPEPNECRFANSLFPNNAVLSSI